MLSKEDLMMGVVARSHSTQLWVVQEPLYNAE